MYKIIFSFLFFTSILASAQNEIKLDIADALVIKSIELSYEKIVKEQSSVGVSVLLNLAEKDAKFRYKENFMITPYYRHNFTTDYNWNFFGEGFLGVNSGEKKSDLEIENSDTKYTDVALGIGVGLKYVSNGGLVIDVLGGLGRNMLTTDSPTIVPRLGVNVGWRF